jgi:hydroxymethylbilane synthase
LIRIGTRSSALALAQARWVAERVGDDTELVEITTSGDRGTDQGDKSRWVSELERALVEGRVDLAVHSAKDVPTELAEGLELVGFPERADPRDVICGARSLADLESGARVGTSSLRRAAQIRALRDDLEIVSARGNVDTRLRKLAAGEWDALVLALAGLERLGRTGEASCNTPVGAHARVLDDRGELQLVAWVGLPDGSAWISDRLRGSADGLGVAVAERMLAVGAGELLARAEREAAA